MSTRRTFVKVCFTLWVPPSCCIRFRAPEVHDMHGLLPLAVVDGLDVVTVRVEYKRGVVVAPVRPLARRSVLLAASLEGCGAECFHLLDARGGERDVARHVLRLAALDRERLVLVCRRLRRRTRATFLRHRRVGNRTTRVRPRRTSGW